MIYGECRVETGHLELDKGRGACFMERMGNICGMAALQGVLGAM